MSEELLHDVHGRVTALEFAFVSLVRMLGDDAFRDRFATSIERRNGMLVLESLQATEVFGETLVRLAEEIREPSIV